MFCRSCNQEKALGEFYPSVLSRCKSCHKLAMRTRSRVDPSVQDYNRARAKLPHRKDHNRSVSKQWRESHPLAYSAQTAVGNAIRDGRLRKGPCSICGTTTKVHAHHRDYSKPLDVTWLCPKCHHRLHATFPELSGHQLSP